MTSKEQHRSHSDRLGQRDLMSGMCLRPATFALALAAVVHGTVASPSAQAQTFKVLYTFTGNPDGEFPYAGLIRDSSGRLYGTTEAGGPQNGGTVFGVNRAGEEVTLYNFSGGADGASPSDSLVADPAGNFYGTTACGGASNSGTVFKVTKAGKETVLYSFEGGMDGLHPDGGLAIDPAGNLYGTTVYGGASNYGTVFEVDRSGTETVLHSFTGGTDGAYPYAGLILDSAGNLFGTTSGGGGFNAGTVFEVDRTGKEVVLYTFSGGADGDGPEAGLARDAAGNLYGTTTDGGNSSCSCGTVFELDTTGKETVLYSFTGGKDGGYPFAAVLSGSGGNLYGTTGRGGDFNNGTVFQLDPTGKETVLYSFTGGTDGSSPRGLVQDSAANLYGTTAGGGANYGVVFELKP